MWTIAIKTLVADRGKLLTALVGVVFSVVLVNVQGGLFLGLMGKASLLVQLADADIWVGHQSMNNVDFPQDVPRRYLQRIRSVNGVKRAEACLLGHGVMTLPTGGFEYVLLIGCDPATELIGGSALRGQIRKIREADGILVDVHDAHKIASPRLGDVREIGRRRARVVGFTEGVLGFLVTPYIFTSIDRTADYLGKRHDVASYFLVQLEDGAQPEEVCAQIQQRLPDLEAFTREQYAAVSTRYWMQRTGLGISFGAATALGLIVGLVIVAQTLHASVLDRLSEFGTLKAIGAREVQVQALILRQALTLAAVGSAIGLVCVLIVQQMISSPRAPIDIPWFVSIGSCTVVTAVCLISSLLPYMRIRAIDPAMVLQS